MKVLVLLVLLAYLSMPSYAQSLEHNYMDMVGAYFNVSYSPEKEVQTFHNITFLFSNNTLLFENVMGIDMKLYPSVAILWFAETNGEVGVNVTREIQLRFKNIANATGGVTNPILREINISGVTWHTISDSDQYIYVALIAYTNGVQTGIVLIEARAYTDEDFEEILSHVQLVKNPPQRKSGPPPQYFF